MAAACTFQALDVATTSYALSQPGISEGNGLWWGETDAEVVAGMLATKIALIGTCYLAGQAWPDSRKWLWGTATFIGGGAAIWNINEAAKGMP